MCTLCLGSAGYLPSYQLGISGCIHCQCLRLIGVCFLATPQDGRWDCPHPKFLSRIHIRTPELGVFAGKEPEHLYICTVGGRMLRIHCGTMNRTAQGAHVGYGTYVNNVASRGRFLTFVFSLLSPRVKSRTS